MSFSVPDSLAWTIVLFVVGLGLICVAGDKFVDAAVAIARRLKIPQIVVGATIVSLGTTLPEILVSTTAVLGTAQSPEISVGNALGSIICNTALIAGIGQLIRPAKEVKAKSVGWRMIYFVAAAVLLFLTVLLTPESDFVNKLGKTEHAVGTIIRAVGIVLVLGFCVYAFLSIKWKDSDGEADYDVNEKIMPLWGALLMLVISAAGLFVGANLLVENGQLLAQRIGVSERVIGVTVIALGTSLPELVTTVTSSVKGQGDVGLGNIIGANLFNMLLVIGLPATITGNVAFTSKSLYLDLPLSLLAMCALILPMLIRKKGSRVQGGLLVLGYLAYCVYSFLAAGA
ncbi:MAG: calcium/sodium antiporter [Clostridia bacterium]|nr:calcium/sodium antiporter [Clostridia bacterium]